MNNKKISNLKIILLAILLIILLIIFNIYVIKRTNNTSNESEVLSYLEKKYQQNFELIELVDNKQYESPKLDIDGSTFIPSKKIAGKYEFYYDVLSISDNVKFNVYLLNDNGKREFQDSYDICKHFENTTQKLQDYVISNIGNTNSKKESIYNIVDYSLYYSCKVMVYLDEKFEDTIDTEFIKKLNLIYNYQVDINYNFGLNYNDNSDGEAYFNTYIYDTNNNYIDIGRAASLNGFYIFNENKGAGIEINEYMEKK